MHVLLLIAKYLLDKPFSIVNQWHHYLIVISRLLSY